MSISVNLYIGPWVEFRIPVAVRPGGLVVQEGPGVSLSAPENDSLCQLNRMCDRIERFEGKDFLVKRFVPNRMRSTALHPAPERKLRIDDHPRDLAMPLDRLIPVQEKIWLLACYEVEIMDMRTESGLDPEICWGFLRGCS